MTAGCPASIDPAETNGAADADEPRSSASSSRHRLPFCCQATICAPRSNRFSDAAQETLPVIDNPEGRRVIGYLSEAYALRRYAHELERHRGSRPDDAGIFSPASGDVTVGPQEPES